MSTLDKDDATSRAPSFTSDETLFRATDGWGENACVDFGRNSWIIYASGYKTAADMLVERVLEQGIGLHVVIYPIAFLYRHYLELRLKELIITGHKLLDQESELKHVHRLDQLWRTCRNIIEEVWPDSDTSDLDAVEQCINQFCLADPLSMSFRYPQTKDGKPTLDGMSRVSIRSLRDVMQRVSLVVESASMGISTYLDDKRTMGSDCCR